MGVDMTVSSRYLDRITRLISQGLAIEVFRPGIEGDEAHRFSGKATVIDNTINPTTSTFLVRAEIANAAKTILPGEYVKGYARVGEVQDAIVVPEQAVLETQAGPTVYTVDKQGKVAIVPVRASFAYEGHRVLESGLQPGQEVIVEGMQMVRPGMTVKTRPASLDTSTGSEGPATYEARRECRNGRQAKTGAVRHRFSGPNASRALDSAPIDGQQCETTMVNFFIDRPIFATVVALLMLLVGGICIFVLPISLYPDIVPPQVQVTTTYTGADAETVADTVTTPIEQQINGVKGQIYFNSDSTSNGLCNIIATFDVGYDQDIAAVDIQNKVSTAQTSLPPEVKQYGVTVKKTSTNMVCVVNLVSPDGRYDATFLDNYAQINVVDALEANSGYQRCQPVRPQVRHEDLARPGPDGQPADLAGRGHLGDPAGEQAGRLRQDRRCAGAARPAVRVPDHGQGSALEERGVREDRQCAPMKTARSSISPTWPASNSTRRTTRRPDGSMANPQAQSPFTSSPTPTPWISSRRCAGRWTGSPRTSPRVWNTASPTTRPSTSARTLPR